LSGRYRTYLARTGRGRRNSWRLPLSMVVATSTVVKAESSAVVVETSMARSRTRWSEQQSNRGMTRTRSMR
jgi:hypothetical protein